MNIATCIIISLIILVSMYPAYAGERSLPPDYAKSESWARIPEHIIEKVDVFYIYPTVYGDDKRLNLDIYDSEMKALVELPLYSQLSVYSEGTNIFAPYYRQMSGAMLGYTGRLEDTECYQTALNDVKNSFKYYITMINPDRPFILAGHSQGSMLLIELMHSDIFASEQVNKRMIAAYLIGYTVKKSDPEQYSWMKLAESSNDTGVIISYNTQSPTAQNSPVLLADAYCINPLNWSTTGKPAERDLNLGAVFFSNDGKISRELANYCGAQIDISAGALNTTPPEELDVRAFPPGVYHIYDYAFWYRNLQQNVQDRIRAYFEEHEKDK